MELWKDIEGYEGYYAISSNGRIKNTRTGKVLAISYSRSSKYPKAVLCKNGVRKTVNIHRLVASAFIPNPLNLPEVNHINEVRNDNRVENLEWCTRLQNIRHGTGIARRAEKCRNDYRSKAVAQYTSDGELVKTYPSLHEVERSTGFSRRFVQACIQGKHPTAYGYKWLHI